MAGNDTQFIFDSLLQAVSSPRENLTAANDIGLNDPLDGVCISLATVMGKVSGPFAFVFYDGISQQIFFGRDRLGRRSLLQRKDRSGVLMLASVGDDCHESEWIEVEADGIYVVRLDDETTFDLHAGSECAENKLAGPPFFTLSKIPRKYEHVNFRSAPGTEPPFPFLNKTLPPTNNQCLSIKDPVIGVLQQHLLDSLTLRVTAVPKPPGQISSATIHQQTRLAILFSGGLDCTVLARLVHDLLPSSEDIDLLNVAFENPRVLSASRNLVKPQTANQAASVKALEAKSQTELNIADGATPYEICPDRTTGRASLKELKQICPGRTWRFVEVNVPYSETQQHRSSVISLIHPHNTEMDLSIAYAFYFAARGRGVVYDTSTSTFSAYKSSARVLLSGLGADELFAGYTRHGTAFSRRGFPGLLNELALDITRLGKRNLGRDDRVISNWGKEVRLPYLDENLLYWALQCPIWQKCGFGQGGIGITDEDEPCLEPGKKVLRLLAYRLGMKGVAREKKRAIQFGSRTAKMESKRSKGTQLLSE
ncbi:MAG: hypothetical protein M1836_003121 [Candelina mexicana]|nr:MAG: hypothetical protein M1836_003121 [Candelina mexicana]